MPFGTAKKIPPPIPDDWRESPFKKNGKEKAPRKRWLSPLARIGIILGLAVVLAAVGAVLIYLGQAGFFSSHEGAVSLITHLQSPDNTVVYDRGGKKIGEFFDNYHVFTPYDRLPENLKNAILATEDRNFWKHGGYDLHAMFRAAFVYLKRRRFEQGASTLTQQLVRAFLLTNEKSVNRKIQEIALAKELERQLTKKKIFELYTNELFLGNGSYGVGAAALRYFAKSVEKLELHEAALIAGLFQSPSAYNPSKYPKRAKARQRLVLLAMVAAKFITEREAEAAYERPLKFSKYVPARTETAPYFVDYIESEAQLALGKSRRLRDNGLRIRTSLDGELQRIAEEVVRESGPQIEKTLRETKSTNWHPETFPKVEVALLSMDPRTGEILAMVGGRNYGENQFNRVTSALRSPGSSFKPVVYSLALQRGYKWSDVLYVAPITINNYRPRNDGNDYLTETTLLRAFYKSMNTPTVELGSKLGIGSVIEHAKKLGVRTQLKPEIGTVIGGSEVTMFDLARMYSVFATGGTMIEPISITRIDDRKGTAVYETPTVEKRATENVLSASTTYLMTEGMRAVLAHGTAFDSRDLAPFAAGKTGTSNEATDNWFCGFTPEILTLVWVGTDDHAPLPPDSHGSTMALPIWDSFMRRAIKLHPPAPFKKPGNIVSASVHAQYGYRVPSGGVRMYFRRGQEPSTKPSALEAVSGNKTYRDMFDDK